MLLRHEHTNTHTHKQMAVNNTLTQTMEIVIIFALLNVCSVIKLIDLYFEQNLTQSGRILT